VNPGLPIDIRILDPEILAAALSRRTLRGHMVRLMTQQRGHSPHTRFPPRLKHSHGGEAILGRVYLTVALPCALLAV
jgi:hypothetical protein